MVSKTWTSPVPAVLDALVALCTAALAGDGWLVKDGPFNTAESEEQVLSVGWSGFAPGYQFPSRSMSEQLGGADVTSEGVQEGLAPSVREKLAIGMASVVRDGGNQVPSARAVAYTALTAVGAAIAPPNHTINGTVLSSVMGAANSLHQVMDRRGALAVVTFTIECTSYPQQ